MKKFFLIFILIQLVFFGLNLLNTVQEHIVLPWTTVLANICVTIVTVFDATVHADGKKLWNANTGFGVSIEAGCNGLEAYIILVAAVIAFPSTWRQKLYGLTFGFLAVQGINIIRVISLFYLGQWNMKAFEFAHEYLWQALIMLDVLIFWLLWVRWCERRHKNVVTTNPASEVA